jgi:hypothetical protein
LWTPAARFAFAVKLQLAVAALPTDSAVMTKKFATSPMSTAAYIHIMHLNLSNVAYLPIQKVTILKNQ